MDKNEAIKEAKKVYDELMADEHERTLIKLREKYIRDYNTIKEDGYNNGYNDGKDAGAKKEKLEIAKKMLKMKLNKEDIIEATGLSQEKLLEIEKEMN